MIDLPNGTIVIFMFSKFLFFYNSLFLLIKTQDWLLLASLLLVQFAAIQM